MERKACEIVGSVYGVGLDSICYFRRNKNVCKF